MKVQNLIMLVVAIVCGALAVYLTKSYIEQEVSTHKSSLDEKYKPVQAVVANRNLKRGDVLSPSMLSIREMPSGYLHKDAIRPSAVDAILGHKLVYSVNKGESLLGSHVAITKGDTFSNLIAEGKRALTFSVDNLSSINGMLAPGDIIDLLVTMKDKEDINGEKTIPLLSNVVIMATNSRTDELAGDAPQKGNRNRIQTVTLHVFPDEAAKITHAKAEGKITVLLRSRSDNDDLKLAAVNKNTLLGKANKQLDGDSIGPRIIRSGVKEKTKP